MNKLPQIQAARGIAVLLVVFFHSYVGVRYFPDAAKVNLPLVYEYGYLGVNLFFAISGFIVGLVAEKPGFSTYSFLVKRFFRIYPLYWVFIGLAILLSICNIAAAGGGNDLSLINIAKNLLIFPLEGEPLYAVGWSLEHEVIFYLMAALLVPHIGVRGLMICMAALGIVGILTKPTWDYHFLAAPQLDFAAGLGLYCFWKRVKALGTIGPLVLGSVMYYLATHGQVRFAALAGEALILLGLINIPLERIKTTFSPLIWIGDISYSLYLCHWILTVLADYPSNWLELPAWLAEQYRFALIALSVLVAALLHAWIEKPLINLGHRVAGAYHKGSLEPSSGMLKMEFFPFRIRHCLLLIAGCLTVAVAGASKYHNSPGLAIISRKRFSYAATLVKSCESPGITLHSPNPTQDGFSLDHNRISHSFFSVRTPLLVPPGCLNSKV